DCVVNHLNTCVFFLRHFNSVDLAVKEDTLDLLIQVVGSLAVSLPALLVSTSLSAAERKEKLNAVKMSVFLLCKLTESLESDSYRQSIVTAPGKGGKKGKSGGEGLMQWDSEREKVLQALIQLLQLDIRPLWNLSLVEEEFISCVTCCCYKLLENPTISHVKSKPTRDCIIHLLGLLIKKYNHLLGASVKVIQLLQHFEQLSSVFAQAVFVWSTEYGVRAIIGEVIREIGQKSSEELAREGSGVKAFASFLSELGALVPDLMIPNISVLITHLEGELWAAMEPELLVTVRTELEPRSDAEKEQDEEEEEEEEERRTGGLLVQCPYVFLLCTIRSPVLSSGSDEDASELSQHLPPTPQKEGEKEGEKDGEDGELKKQEMLVQYLRDTETFALQVERAISVINTMLYWKTTSVVQEAVQFCVTVCEFSVANSVSGVRKMLPLVWSTDAAIKDAVVQAYRRLYLNPQGDTIRMKAQTLVDSLSELMVDASLGTIQCLEEIVSDSILQSTVVQVLWERFTGKRETSALHKRAAVLLLGMAREVVLSNLDTLCSVALGEKVTEDFLLARDTVITICSITDHVRVRTREASVNTPPFRAPASCGVVMEDPYWQSFMEQAVRLLYFLAESPDQLCSRLLQRSARLVLDQIAEVSCVSLAQLLAVCGAVAFWQVSHLERSVSAELRRRRGETEEREEKEKGPASKAKVANESAMEEELGLMGASADDTEAELIRKICETELLAEENLLSAFLPLLVRVCSSPGRYSHPQLTTAACLALSQYMMISPSVCEEHIRLMFTVLERSTLPVVRANAIIALGDLTVRFPNILEPWTQNLYARLSDEVPSVRQTAVTVLTQLVLKDVLKVKGQVSEVAVLLIDPEPHITSLALNFFNELATKDNAIYNLLPDIISRLSDPERGMSSEDFNTIMKQLFSYITKERQTESLVEKLCQRFRTAKTERQWCDLAVSLSLLSMCERGFKRLQECWECYSDKLTEPGVYQPLLSITAKLRRGAKPQFKAQVDEFEKRLTAVHTRGLENVESPEMDEENQRGGGPAEKTLPHTNRPSRGRAKSKRGRRLCGPETFRNDPPEKNKPTRCVFFSFQAKRTARRRRRRTKRVSAQTPFIRRCLTLRPLVDAFDHILNESARLDLSAVAELLSSTIPAFHQM
uniref:Condensin complex subunit 1 n=1 Tax=Stegastes partitus TaxID=144197 RepID=A0A3B5A064_9TELE